jgi:hypothetical protein
MAIRTWPEQPGSRVVLRTYGGKSQGEMLGAYQRDAEQLLAQGYEPAGLLYIEGSYSGWYVAVVVLCVFVLIGIPIAIRMLLQPRPPGSLVATYTNRGQAR